ncbi:hypothetical protein KQ296_12295 [Synechococcus sp. CS-197]|nr:hypothetical protein [Synechococcus sp. CS-197]PTT98788.1 hypothetical protein DBR45_31340 [Pseudomonas sp. HMWF031]
MTTVTKPGRFHQRYLHQLGGLAGLQPKTWEGSDRRSKRRKQQRRLIQQCIEADPAALQWLFIPERGQLLWKALRWGGPGLLIGWWLGRS